MAVLVIGATGRVASHLTRKLLATDVSVRALVRNRDKATAGFASAPGGTKLDVVAGAFDDAAVLRRALDGIDTVFLALGTSLEQITLEKGLIDAAARAKVGQIVRLSVLGADAGANYEVGRRHGELDDYLVASGVPNTRLRPAYFSSNLLLAAASIVSANRWFGSAPDGRIAIIDTRDVSDAAATVIRNPALQNATYDLTGPSALTFPEVADLFTKVLDHRVSYVPVDQATLRQGYAGRGVPDWLTDIALGIDRAMQSGSHAVVTRDLAPLLGEPPRTVEDFIRDHRAAFLAAPAAVAP
jgi:uncharacterized protein YbjT (DUF2867 family)